MLLDWMRKPLKGKVPWHDVPELNNVHPARARHLYENAMRRLKGGKATWLMIAGEGAFGSASMALIETYYRSQDAGRVACYWAVGLICAGAAFYFYAHRRRVLRQFVRADLGTHCPQCDYDLRGTPEPPPPEEARCPECGWIIPHDPTRPLFDVAKSCRSR